MYSGGWGGAREVGETKVIRLGGKHLYPLRHLTAHTCDHLGGRALWSMMLPKGKFGYCPVPVLALSYLKEVT